MSSTFVDTLGTTGTLPSRVAHVPAPDDNAIDTVVDAAIEAAPECVRRRIVLPSIDWSAVSPHRANLLLSSLAQAHVAPPKWLLKALLLAGHTLPCEVESQLSAYLMALSHLNRATGEAHERGAFAATLGMLTHADDLDGDIVTALVQRLMGLSWDEEALCLALAQFHHVPQALRHTGTLFNDYVERLPPARLLLAGSSNTDTLAEALVPAFAVEGRRAEITPARFAQVLTELLNPPDDVNALILLLDLEGLATRDWRKPAADGLAILAERAKILAEALSTFSKRSSVPLLINSISPAVPTTALLDRRHAMRLRRGIDLFNERLRGEAERSKHIILIDTDQALSAVPAREQTDPKFWRYGKVAYSAEATRHLARSFAEAWKQNQTEA